MKVLLRRRNESRTAVMSCLLIALASSACMGQSGSAEPETNSSDPTANQAFLRTADASAAGVPSTKASAFFGDIAILNSSDLAWTNIMTTQIKTSNQKTLFIVPSLECGLYTSTTVRSQKGRKDTSTATAAIDMQVLVDGVAASPGVVVYCSRTQQLSATLNGILQSCTDVNGDGTITSDECNVTDEEISLLLNTMDAASFNFGANVAAGVHNVSVQAKISTSTSAQTGSADAFATIGKGSVVVTEQGL